MITNDRSDAGREPLAPDALLTPSERRLTVDQHHTFRESLAPRRPLDPIDELLEEIRAAELEGKGTRP
jgi:hypothetical protein